MKSSLKISVVIPTKNEETFLPRLLHCLVDQTLKPYEIIVADAFSKDATREIAAKNGCKIVDGGLPAKGRNNGARYAKGDYIFFFDADVRISADFLEKAAAEIIKNKLKVGTCFNVPYYIKGDKGYFSSFIRLQDKLIYIFHNLGLIVSSKLNYPFATGTFIFCERKLFINSGGFDESVVVFEDSEFVERASKMGKYGVLKNVVVEVSTRRFDKKGRFLFPSYIALRSLLRPFIGEVKESDYFSEESGK